MTLRIAGLDALICSRRKNAVRRDSPYKERLDAGVAVEKENFV